MSLIYVYFLNRMPQREREREREREMVIIIERKGK